MSEKVSKLVLCDRCHTFASLSEDELDFSWQAQHFGDLHRHFAWQVQHFRRVLLSVFLRIALSELRQVVTKCKSPGKPGISRECHFAWQGQYLVHVRCVWNVILRGGHNISNTLHFRLGTLHSTL